VLGNEPRQVMGSTLDTEIASGSLTHVQLNLSPCLNSPHVRVVVLVREPPRYQWRTDTSRGTSGDEAGSIS